MFSCNFLVNTLGLAGNSSIFVSVDAAESAKTGLQSARVVVAIVLLDDFAWDSGEIELDSMEISRFVEGKLLDHHGYALLIGVG